MAIAGKRAEFFFDFAAALFFLFGLARIGKRRWRTGRDVAEIFLGERDPFVGLYVAEHQEHGIVGHVIGFEEGLNVEEIGGVEIGEIAIEIVGVGPIAEGYRRQVEPGEAAVRLIHDVDADFFFHYVALVAQVFVINLQRAHAICFQPQNAIKRVARHGLVIVGYVVVGRAVQQTATGIDQLDVLHFRGVRRALEHHVFEQVREATAPLRLETKANFVVHADGNDRSRSVRRDDHFQAIRQCLVFHYDLTVIHPLPPMDCAFVL